jgi:hypothetical protein
MFLDSDRICMYRCLEASNIRVLAAIRFASKQLQRKMETTICFRDRINEVFFGVNDTDVDLLPIIPGLVRDPIEIRLLLTPHPWPW